jgi:hypothetical protein
MTNAISPTSTPIHQEVFFVTGDLSDLATLLAGLPANGEIHVLDATQDGLTQMVELLAGRSGLDAIHILSHGSTGALQLGTSTLNEAALTSRASDLALIGQSLSAEGDILLYGCNVAAGETGAQFVGKLAQVTGGDVATSTDLTGAASLGGNWVLETQTGVIESSAIALADYRTILGDYTTVTFSTVGLFANGAAQEPWSGSTDVPGLIINFQGENGTINRDTQVFSIGGVNTGISTKTQLLTTFTVASNNSSEDFDIQSFKVYNPSSSSVTLNILGYGSGLIEPLSSVLKSKSVTVGAGWNPGGRRRQWRRHPGQSAKQRNLCTLPQNRNCPEQPRQCPRRVRHVDRRHQGCYA